MPVQGPTMASKRFLTDTRGNFTISAALIATPILVAVFGAVDVANSVRLGSELQDSLDGAVLEIAVQSIDGYSEEQLTTIGSHFHDSNFLYYSDPQSVEGLNFSYLGRTELPDGSVRFEVSGAAPYEGTYQSLMDTTIRRTAQAVRMVGLPACILSLSETASVGIDLDGTTDVGLTNCIIAANSKSEDSVSRSGAATVGATCVQTAGKTSGIIGDDHATMECGSIRENSFKTPDPLADVEAPLAVCGPNLNLSGNNKSLKQVYAGTYCNNALTINGGERVHFNPGTYIFKGTDISVLGGGELTGTDVTIFLLNDGTDQSSLDISANSLVDLAAPTSGTYAGILIYQSADNDSTMKLNGGADSDLQGYIYSPSGLIDFAGNNGTTGSQCLRLVADTINLTGTSDLKSDCSAALAGREALTISMVRLSR